MINAVEVRNFRSLKYIYQPLRQFQVLVGTKRKRENHVS